MASLPRSVPPAGIMGIRKSLLVGIVVGVVAIGLGAAWGVQRLTATKPKAAALPPLPVTATLTTGRKAILADEPRTYDAIPKPKPKPVLPPQGIPVTRVEAATRPPEPPRPEPRSARVEPLPTPPGPSPAEIEARIRAGIAEAKAQMREEQARMLEAQLAAERSRQGGQAVQGQQGPPKPKAQREWEYLARPKERAKETKDAMSDEQRKALATHEEARDLIHRAKWAMPDSPLQTLYRSQTMTGVLLQSISSDLPGQVKIQLTTPTLDKFGYDTIIIPKDSIVIASQEGRPTYGQSRIPIRLEQLEFPSGEVVSFKAAIGSQDGANGLEGKTNNHYSKLILATGLSALLNIGVRAGTGTPGRGQYYENVAQESARDIGQSVQRDAQGIVDRELRIPPTITIPLGTSCTINLQENIQFNHAPSIVR